MKWLQLNRRSVITRLPSLLLLVTLSCTERYNTDQQPETGNQKIIMAGRPSEKTGNTDTIRLTDLPLTSMVFLDENLIVKQVLGPLISNVQADSICWEFLSATPGFSMEPKKGKGNHYIVSFSRQNSGSTGEITVKATPFRSRFFSESSVYKFIFQNCRDTATGKPVRTRCELPPLNYHGCAPDTTLVNRQRRKQITEFRDLLYMYAKTTSAREKEYFKTDAENKLNEIPGRTVDILPDNGLGGVFADPRWSNPLVLPVYDTRRCYITGIKVRQQ